MKRIATHQASTCLSLSLPVRCHSFVRYRSVSATVSLDMSAIGIADAERFALFVVFVKIILNRADLSFSVILKEFYRFNENYIRRSD